MPYAMPASVTFCLTGGAAVFLDTCRNRYFRLGPRLDADFQALAEAGPSADLDMGSLVRLGVLQPAADGHGRLNRADAPAPLRSLVEEDLAAPRLGARLAPRVGFAVAVTQARLTSSSLACLVARHRALRQEAAVGGARPANGADLYTLSASFNRLRRLVPIDTVCLLDSFALLRFLAGQGHFPQLIMGVRLNPFAAHCWVQQDDMVLNDAVERASTYTPILAV